jgi:hypothetical protein
MGSIRVLGRGDSAESLGITRPWASRRLWIKVSGSGSGSGLGGGFPPTGLNTSKSGPASGGGAGFDGGNMAALSGNSTRSSVRPSTSVRATTTSKTSRSISQ